MVDEAAVVVVLKPGGGNVNGGKFAWLT